MKNNNYDNQNQEGSQTDPWLNLEFLKLALKIEESKNQKKVVYVDVGTLPKKEAEEMVSDLISQHEDQHGNFWIPRREGGRGSEIVTLPPGGATVETVLETAKKLKEFASKL